MGLRESVKTCLQQYATFSGRASRSEYWYWILFCCLLGFVTGIFDAILFPSVGKGTGSGPLSLLVSLGTLLPSLGVAVRRLHDTNRSGWWILLPFAAVPAVFIHMGLFALAIIGLMILQLVWYCTKGTSGDNRFGPDPLAPQMVG